MAVDEEQRGSSTPDSGGESPIDIEKLGRQRPEMFKSLWSEFGFAFALLFSMLFAEFFVSGFHVILPPLAIDLEIPQASQTWPSSVFALVTGAFLLPMGRLGDMYGGYLIFNGGLIWFFIWVLVSGFSKNYVMLIVCRALQGLGPAAYLPGGIMLLGKIYRPGPRKNLVFAMYGAFAPLGFFFGILIGGLAAEYLNWRWYFWIGTIMLAFVVVASLLAVPFDYPGRGKRDTNIEMDWWGVATIVPGLLLVVYALTDSSHAPQGWKTPYIIVTLILGVAFLTAAWYVQTRVSVYPLLPTDLFATKYMKRLSAALFMSYGSFGVFLFYSSFYMELVLHKSPITTALWYTPMFAGGLILATIGGFTLHLLPGRLLLVISAAANATCMILFALLPNTPNFWAWIFPAMICATMGIDITYTVTNVFITTNVPSHRQGVAGALINSLLFLGISFFLGIADIAVGQTSHLGLRQSYKVAFWLAFGVALLPLIIFPFLKIGSAKSDLTLEERQKLEAEARSLNRAGDTEAESQENKA